jgi:hypothetical protein
MALDRDALNQALLQAHEKGDGAALVSIYTTAADQSEALGDVAEACFFMTQAYVFALENGLTEAARLNQRLASHGREVVQEDLTS